MEAVPKYLLGAYAATVLEMAIKHTKHDSSRFAANWNLAVGEAAPLNSGNPDPYHYNSSGDSYGTVGKKRDAGKWKESVVAAKRMYYGYADAGGYMKLTKGRLSSALYPRAGKAVSGAGSLSGVALGWRDKAGTPPKIYLYNAFMRPGYVPFRKSGWVPLTGDTHLRTGETYPHYALPSGGVKTLEADVASVMGQGLLQEAIHTLATRMRAANAQNTIMDPFL
jgi:hypothetical protein